MPRKKVVAEKPQAKVDAAKPRAQRRIVSNTLANASGASIGEEGAVRVAVDTVTVTVAKPFTLTADDHTAYPYPEGVQEMPKDHAEHWYAKAHGVEVYKK